MKSSLGVKFDMKSMFFDRPAVMKAVEAKERRVLMKVGAYVMTSAKSSIRSKRRPTKGRKRRGRPVKFSKPGEPPISWSRRGIKRIFYYWNREAQTVGVGPEQFGNVDITGTLELGGLAKFKDPATGNMKQGRWEPRPFMGPALEKNETKILDIFEDGGF